MPRRIRAFVPALFEAIYKKSIELWKQAFPSGFTIIAQQVFKKGHYLPKFVLGKNMPLPSSQWSAVMLQATKHGR
ncbi:MAG: hypothetical protein C0392_01450 [Syntrophus sp. (in: bacteria)]|nr:hypothetical protein [Syntrophus sp. (in: bacteria)]